MKNTIITAEKSFNLKLFLENSKEIFMEIRAKIERTQDNKTSLRFFLCDEKRRIFKFTEHLNLLWGILLSDLNAFKEFLINNLDTIPFTEPSTYREQNYNFFQWDNICWILKTFTMGVEETSGPSIFEMRFYAYEKTGLKLGIFKDRDSGSGIVFYANDEELNKFAFGVSSFLEASLNN